MDLVDTRVRTAQEENEYSEDRRKNVEGEDYLNF